ncbi:hypothetical protein F4781DRAFT_429248 [Annulohypoxylon bovei var. microspora]|nr:hypothetical protein F4781DRAFT_429248 [Annulohypoxylon bovei var. microspora]
MSSPFLPEECRGLMSEEEAAEAAVFLLGGIEAIERSNEETQIDTLLQVSHLIGNFFERDELELLLGWVLERYRTFRTHLSAECQRRYLIELVAWRSMEGTHDGIWMAYFLPGIYSFQFPPGPVTPSFSHNWFAWWATTGQTQNPPTPQSSTAQANRDMDLWFLDYVYWRDEHREDSAEMPMQVYSERYTAN